MRKIILTLLLILILANAFAVHCFINQTLNSTPTISWGEGHIALDTPITIDEKTINNIVLPDTILTYKDFGHYNVRCNNGWDSKFMPLTMLEFTGEGNFPETYNTLNNAKASRAYGLPWCEGSGNSLRDGSTYPGKGTYTKIKQTINTQNGFEHGFYNVKGSVDKKTTADAHCTECIEKINRDFFFAPYASLFIFTSEDEIIRFYEKEGTYETSIFFTIVKNHPLKIKIENLNIECDDDPAVNCEILNESDYSDLELVRNNEMTLIEVKIKLNKETYSKKFFNVQLKIDYTLPQVNADVFETESEPKIFRIGLMDQQDFQIKIIGDDTGTTCVSYDGLIGVTGPIYSPRINLTFAEDNSGVIRTDTCNLLKEDGNLNENWVYCTQNEFIFSVLKNVQEIMRLQDEIQIEKEAQIPDWSLINEKETELEKYTGGRDGFESNIRDVDFSEENIIDKLNAFDIELAEETGLEFISMDVSEQIKKITELIEDEKLEFTANGGTLNNPDLIAGKYNIKISVDNPLENRDLSNSKIIIDLSNHRKPAMDWFFYRNEVLDIDDLQTVIPENLYETNVDQRGIILSFTKEPGEFNPSNFILRKTFATPMFMKIERDSNEVKNEFSVETTNPTDYAINDNFGFWSGFASTRGDGCTDISAEENETKPLIYRNPDRIISIGENGRTYNVKLEEYDNISQEDKQLLQTVIYAPYQGNAGDNITFESNASFYTDHTDCIRDCESLILKGNESNFISNNLTNVFRGIENNEICIGEEIVASGRRWILFWNEDELLRSMNSKKQTVASRISGLDICIDE
jgi:hypothetical protein